MDLYPILAVLVLFSAPQTNPSSGPPQEAIEASRSTGEVAGAVRSSWVDFDGDGADDLVLLSPGKGLRLLRNVGVGGFEDITELVGLAGLADARQVSWADLEGDSDPDLVAVTMAGEVRLFSNEEGELFVPIEAGSGLELLTGVWSATWHDVDGDALPDLLLRTGEGFVLQRNAGAGRFEPVRLEASIPGAAAVLAWDPVPSEPQGAKSDEPAAAGTPVASVDDRTAAALGRASVRLGARQRPPEISEPRDLRPPSPGQSIVTSSSALEEWVDESGDTMTGTLTLEPVGDKALDIRGGSSVYKGGKLFLHNKAPRSTALGIEAMATGSGTESTAIGYQTLYTNTTGFHNTAVGHLALFSNTIGTANTANGSKALWRNTTGRWNTGVGYGALNSNTTGDINTALGFLALRANTSGSANVAIGDQALFDNTGDANNALGARALTNNTTGFSNTAVGTASLRDNTSGNNNTASGHAALSSNTTGSFNTASGGGALVSNTTGDGNTATGFQALFYNTTGTQNTGCGYRALSANSTGVASTAIGYRALENSTGNYNNAVGAHALRANTTGSHNTACGSLALRSNTTGRYNTATGLRALGNNTTGIDNTAIGYLALYLNTTGYGNIALGGYAGLFQTGSDNIAIGNLGSAGDAGTIKIGNAADHTKTFIAGIRGVTTVNANAIPVFIDSAGQLGTVSSSRRFKEDIRDMAETTARLLELRPVLFRYKKEVAGDDRPVQFGLIAEEVAEVFPELVVFDDEGQPFTVKYHLLSSMLLNELQEQHEQDEAQARELEELRAEVGELRNVVSRAFSNGSAPSRASRRSPKPSGPRASARQAAPFALHSLGVPPSARHPLAELPG